MKILVFSDAHGDTYCMRRALSMNPDADYAIFLGDGIRDAETVFSEFPSVSPLIVRGNCDFFQTDYPTVRILHAGGKKILICHGHTFSVKGGRGGLIAEALREGVDIALYGHTHEARCDYVDQNDRQIYIVNPGSIHRSYLGSGEYALIVIKGNDALVSLATVS